jgi:Flp pilus assembly protein TadD
MRRARLALLAAVVGLALTAAAEPYESDPDLATRDADYAAGKAAVDAKDWKEAAQRFERALVRNPDHADLQNIAAFTYRNLGQYDLALRHYKRALEIDPRHRGAHEYLGETYLLTNDLEGARRHLQALREICLLPCDELGLLDKAIATYVERKKRPG